MSRAIAINPDGSTFFADLSAESSVRITLREAYNLANYLRDLSDTTFKSIDAAIAKDEAGWEVINDLQRIAQDCVTRATEIERLVSNDKAAQHVAAGNGWRVEGPVAK